MTYPDRRRSARRGHLHVLDVCASYPGRGMRGWRGGPRGVRRPAVRLVSVTTGVHVDGTTTEPCPAGKLHAAELEGLYSLLLAGAEASDDESVVRWCTRMGRLIVAEIYRREYIQVAIDAKAAAIEAEERRLACERGRGRASRTVCRRAQDVAAA